nr:reverse transcriptase domain-containing protein [Tanacetum cinerariifolium]
MTLELADRSISRPVGVAEEVFVKVGTFHFPSDFVVVDFDADPRVPLILRRSFLKTGTALINVFEGELTLRVGKKAITFNLDQTSRYLANYNDMTTNRIDVIDMVCEEYSQEVLGFFDVIASGNPTPYYDPIVSTTSPTLTPFGESDFLLEEVDAFLALEYDPTLPKVDQSYVDTEGDILLLEAFLNDDPSLPPPNQGNCLPQVRKELKICEAKTDKSSIDEPYGVDLKDLPPHLEYVFLEGDDKFLVIIEKDLSVEEKTALITVLNSHKRAIAWKLSDIKGIDPEFYTHKILMEEDFELAVQHQRRDNPKIHDVIKYEVLKLLDAGLIYPISDSPCLNEAARKEHFPLPFMDQILERLAGNEYYCFLDGFSCYFQISIDPKDQEKTTFTCLTEHLPTVVCLLGYAMHRARFREKMLKQCEDTNLCLNWKKIYFMVKEGIVLGHKISKNGIEVDKAKVEVIAKLPHPTTVKGAVLGKRQEKHFRPIHYASKTMTEAESNYTTTEKEMLAVVYRVSPPNKWLGGGIKPWFKKILERTMGDNRASWSDKLDDALWAFRTAYKTPIGCTSYKLVYGKACHLPIELEHKAYWALKHANYDLQTAGDHRKVQLNELNELRDQAYENSLIYKEKTKRLHDSKIKDRVFNIGDRVLLFNSRLKIFSGKLKTHWSGPFTISYVFPYGTVELSQPDGPNFKVNGHRLKYYFGEDIPKMVVPDLQTFLKDQ